MIFDKATRLITFDKTTFLNTIIYNNYLVLNDKKVYHKHLQIYKANTFFCVFNRHCQYLLGYKMTDNKIIFTDGNNIKYYIEEDIPEYRLTFWLSVFTLAEYNMPSYDSMVYNILRKHPFFGEKIKQFPMEFICQ